MPPPNSLREQVLEVLVDLFERRQQPLARLAVEALDAQPQFLDRFHQVVAFGGEVGVLGLDLAQLFLGAQVDRAQPLALAAQPLQRCFDLGQFGQRLAGLDARPESATADGLDLQHVADFAADVGEPALGALEALLGAGQFLARGAGRFERGAGVAVGFGQRVLGLGQAIRAGAPRGFRVRNLADQALAFLGENLRRVFEFGAVALGLRDALVERGDLVTRAVAALDPAGLVGGERRQAPVGQFGLAHDRLLLGAHLGELGALGR